jgi:tRNA U34 2-thiouridine synthase MnmA/TrmU
MHTAAIKDSQSICLFDKDKIQEFIAQYITDSPAHIVTVNGRVLGRHNGLLTVTAGQRHGLNLPSNGDNKDYIVPCKDAKSHTMIEETESERLNPFYKNKVIVRNLSITHQLRREGIEIAAKSKSCGSSQKATFHYLRRSICPADCVVLVRFTKTLRSQVAKSLHFAPVNVSSSGRDSSKAQCWRGYFVV